MSNTKILVTGAGGFIGHHLTSYLKMNGNTVIGVDLKLPEFEKTRADKFVLGDLREKKVAERVTKGVDQVYALAADMGGMGYITTHHAEILYNNAMVNWNTLEAARKNGVQDYLYTSSACVYPEYRQTVTNVQPLKEEDAYPADPQDAYGWEKLITEQLCTHYREDYGIQTRMVRFHNIFGPAGTWNGGREKAPAALCRKIAVAKLTKQPSIDVWGDGEQTRSFCYIDDCTRGLGMIMESGYPHPVNLGQDRMVSINELAQIIMTIAEYPCDINHIEGPLGVRGRNSDNTLITKTIGWAPEVSLEEGLRRTYNWIEDVVNYSIAKGITPETLSRSVVYK
jgi:GDP-D-mannose 3', 5'-epimerase